MCEGRREIITIRVAGVRSNGGDDHDGLIKFPRCNGSRHPYLSHLDVKGKTRWSIAVLGPSGEADSAD